MAVRLLDSFLSAMGSLFETICVAMLAVMLLINGANIFSRAVLDYSMTAAWSWTQTLFVWGTFFSFFPIYRSRTDVSIFFFIKKLNAQAQRVVGVFVYVTILWVVAVVLVTAPKLVDVQDGIIEIIDIPRYYLCIPLFASCALIALEAVLNIITLATGSSSYRPFSEPEDQAL